MTNSLKTFANCKSEISIGSIVAVSRFVPATRSTFELASGIVENIVKHNQHAWRLEFIGGNSVEVSSNSRIEIF